MPAQARVETRATWNDVDLQAGIRASENKLQAFQSKAQRLFRRDPAHRAETAISGFLADLSTGNVEGAITGISSRLTGLGLAAGVGLGIAAVLIHKAKDELDAMDKSVEKVQADLTRPLPVESALGVEGIHKEIETVSRDLEDLAKKRLGFFQRTREAGASAAEAQALDLASILSGKQPEGPKAVVLPAQAAQEAAFRRIHALRLAEVETEAKLVEIRSTGLTISEEEAAIAKIQQERDEKVAAKRLQFGQDPREAVNLHREIIAINQDAALSIDIERQKHDIKQRSLKVEEALAEMALRGASAEEQKVEKLRAGLKLIQDQLSLNKLMTPEQRRELRVQETTAKVALREEEMKNFFKTPQQRAQEATQQAERERQIKQFEEAGGLLDLHKDISGRPISGIDPATGKRVQVSQPDQLDVDLPDISPTHMTPFGGSDEFNKFFHPEGVQPVPEQPSEDNQTDPLIEGFKDAIDSVMEKYWG